MMEKIEKTEKTEKTPSITVLHRRAGESARKSHPGAAILDLTSRGSAPWVKFSPFYPHGGIPVPGAPGRFSASVEGLWQALKVFEHADVDPGKLDITSMKGIKRGAGKLGRVLGHREGLGSERLLGYIEARHRIYLPAYHFVLTQHLQRELAELRRMASAGGLILLDYETNTDVDDPARPLSHAGLVMHWLQDTWPTSPRVADTSAS
jgi:hypothetical protein